ncbi:hypothetical protein FOXYSP1_06713 [Fusarium oxysporum f. sp. phaseoli]
MMWVIYRPKISSYSHMWWRACAYFIRAGSMILLFGRVGKR